MKKRLISVLLILALLACALPAQAASGTLRRGSRGAAVMQLQTALKALGFYTMKVDGIFGRGTDAAVRTYQRRNGLAVDGIAGPKTLGKLYGSAGGEQAASPAQPSSGSSAAAAGRTVNGSLKLGSSGDDVKDLQAKLRYTGYYTGSVTGSFDTETHAAVLAFLSGRETGDAAEALAQTEDVHQALEMLAKRG